MQFSSAALFKKEHVWVNSLESDRNVVLFEMGGSHKGPLHARRCKSIEPFNVGRRHAVFLDGKSLHYER